jgi:hypothetical protein
MEFRYSMTDFLFTRIRPRPFASDTIWGQLKPSPDWLPPFADPGGARSVWRID